MDMSFLSSEGISLEVLYTVHLISKRLSFATLNYKTLKSKLALTK